MLLMDVQFALMKWMSSLFCNGKMETYEHSLMKALDFGDLTVPPHGIFVRKPLPFIDHRYSPSQRLKLNLGIIHIVNSSKL
jgi:hypothetical protein